MSSDMTILNKNKRKILLHCRNSSKIKQTNYRNRDETDIPAEHINGRLLSWLGTKTSIKSGGG
jgi:hypothetical protein